MKNLVAAALFTVFGVSCAQAQVCTQNFTSGGGMYSTWQVFPGLDPAVALDNLARAGSASGFWVDMQVDRRAGIIRAENDGAHNGRTQAVRVTARRQGKGTRVDYSIALEPGQTSSSGFHVAICKFLFRARGG